MDRTGHNCNRAKPRHKRLEKASSKTLLTQFRNCVSRAFRKALVRAAQTARFDETGGFGYRRSMQQKNFTWSSDIYLQIGDRELDLHNDYDFLGISYDVQARSVTLSWRRGTGDWVNPGLPFQVLMTMTGVFHVRFEPRDPAMPFTEDDCLAGFGYDCDADWADGHFWTEGTPDPDWRWSFEFQSGATIVVGGEWAEVTLQSNAADDQVA